MSEEAAPKRAAAKAVETPEELEALLLEGLKNGEAQPVTEADWESLRQRALSGSELRKSG